MLSAGVIVLWVITVVACCAAICYISEKLLEKVLGE